MSLSSMIQVGVQSFQDLGAEFIASVFFGTTTGKSSVICGIDEHSITTPDPSSSSLQTLFYLQSPWSVLLGEERNNSSTDSTSGCAGSDWVVIFLLVVLIHCISWWTRWLIWEPLGNARMKGVVKRWTVEECRRFSQTCTSLLFFTTSAFFGSRILFGQSWLFDRYQWDYARNDGYDPVPIDAEFKMYYLVYLSRFCSDLISIFFEDRKTDAFYAAFIHHLVTIGLVSGSATFGQIRYGGIIMFFFDWADIPLLLAKVFKYLSLSNGDFCQNVANRLFEVFAVSFFLTRNVYYTYVVYCAWMDIPGNLTNRICQYMLIALVVLQTYWMGLIIQAAIRQSKNDGNVEDVREDKNDDGENIADKKKQK